MARRGRPPKAERGDNHITLAKKKLEAQGMQAIITPDVSTIPNPKRFGSIADIFEEMQRVYRMVFEGKIHISDMTKMLYALNQMVQSVKAQKEIDTMEDAYAKQWQGVRIIAPSDKDAGEALIEAEALRDED